MTKKLLFFICMLFCSMSFFAQTPDFSCVGFATMNGGTTGGKGGEVVTVVNLDQFKKYVSEKDATPRIIYVKGTLEGAGGGEMIAIGSNKSIIGVGAEGKVKKVQLYLKNSKNIIIQNLFFTMEGSTLGSDADCISIATTGSSKCQNIWIDHCEFDNNLTIKSNPSASEKDKYDGLLDIKKSSEYITISWSKFKNHYKAILVGFTDDDTYDRKITMHHNAFININSRTPSFRGGTAHIYNNYWESCYEVSTDKYFSTGVNSREEACLYVESNYFKNMAKTVYCALEDVSKEGYAFYKNNVMDNSVAETANTCSSFTPPYTVAVDNGADVPALITEYAGVGILTTPSNIPDPEGGVEPPAPALLAPYLNAARLITPTGFNIDWNLVADATEYVVRYSYDEEIIGEGVIFKETFDNIITTKAPVITSALTDNNGRYTSLGGNSAMVCGENGTMDLVAGRFKISDLNLAANPTLLLKCKLLPATTSAGYLQVMIDNETTSNIVATAVYNEKDLAEKISATEFTTLSIPLKGTSNSFVQIRADSKTAIRIAEMEIVGNASTINTIEELFVLSGREHCLENLFEGREYKVQVMARNASESSAWSNAIYVTPASATGIHDNAIDKIRVYARDGYIQIENAEENAVRIYNLQGRLLYKGVNANLVSIPFTKGLYIVTVGAKKCKIMVN